MGMDIPCAGQTEKMFPIQGGFTQKHKNAFRKKLVKARMLCKDCPVKQECIHRAVTEGHCTGIWGGVNFDDSNEVREALNRRQYDLYNRKVVQRFRDIEEVHRAGKTLESP